MQNKPKQQAIAGWLEQVQFKKQLIGGVSEQDVWKKVSELNALYEDLLKAERIRYDTLLEQMRSDKVGAGDE